MNGPPPDAASEAPAAQDADVSSDAVPCAGAEPVTIPLGGAAHLPLHVNARGLALGIIAGVALLFALQWAQRFLIPLVFGVFIAYTLNPLVAWLERRHIPRVVGATLVTVMILGGAGAMLPTLHGEFQSIVDELPAATHKLSKLLSGATDGRPNTIQKMQAAATEIQQATGSGPTPPHKNSAPVERGGFRVIDWVWAGSMGLFGFIGQATMVIFLVFFLLLAGDTFKRKLVKLTGPSLRQKKITVHILDEINTSIQNYMVMLLVTNILLALLMWVALRFIGLQNAGAWAVVAGLLHIMPYFGPLLITCAIGLAAFMQFDSLHMVVLVGGVSLGIATLIGTVMTTWMTGRIAKMNPAAVFVSLLFWGWLWGVWGMLLGVPVIVILKVVAERVDGMGFVAELLSE